MTADKILEIARGELGATEFPPGSNNVKYNTAYYGSPVKGPNLAWCAVFVWWVFREAGAGKLYYGGEKTAYCPALMSYHIRQAVRDGYKPGDVIFFNFSGGRSAAHVGICESWDGTYITTIDGNTGTGNEANGGAVMRRRRHKQYIVGAYRPEYEEEIDVTQEQFDAMMADWLKRQEKKPAQQTWQQNAVEQAEELGISDGSRPLGICTRVDAMQMAINAVRASRGEVSK